MVTTGDIFVFRMKEDVRHNSVEVDIAAWKYVKELFYPYFLYYYIFFMET